MHVNDAARIAHEVNRAYVYATTGVSEPRWEEAPEWMKKSAINGIQMHWDAGQKGQLIHPWDSHEAWMKEKIADGWKHGPVKDPEKKEHPCILPYKDLPKDQQVKDFLFGAVAVQTLSA